MHKALALRVIVNFKSVVHEVLSRQSVYPCPGAFEVQRLRTLPTIHFSFALANYPYIQVVQLSFLVMKMPVQTS